MATANLPADDSLSPDDLVRVIAACDRFQADWNAGRPRQIEDEIATADKPVPSRLFRELLVLELELVRGDGRLADLDAYLARFPERAETVREVFAGDTVAVSNRELTGAVTNNEPGTSAEGYEFIRELGKGGQATTYLARDRAFQRLVVHKR